MRTLISRPGDWFTGWPLWSLSRQLISFVLITEVVGVGSVAFVWPRAPIDHRMLLEFGFLCACVVAHMELTKTVERYRQVTSGTGSFTNSDTAWCIAGAVALPPILANGVVVFVFIWSWIRIWHGRRPLHRWIFTAATVLVATQVQVAVQALDPGVFPGVPTRPEDLGIAVLAGALRWLVNFALVNGAIVLSSPNVRAIQLLENFSERVLELGAFGLGVVAAGLLVYNPLLLAGIVVGVAAMDRGMLVNQFRKAARTDAKTGLHTAGWWHQIAHHLFERAQAAGTAMALLMLDLDHFKRVNDTYGHVAGDHVLRAVAQAISSEIRDCDTAGRWGGEEFAILLPGVDAVEMQAIAERVRRRVPALVVPIPEAETPTVIQDLTISIGGVRYPAPGITGVDELVLAADAALYQAKTNGRNRVHFG